MISSSLAAPSFSRLAKLHSCRRAYYYRYVRGLRSPGEATPPLAGKALHAALDVLYRKGFEAHADAEEALVQVYDGHEPSANYSYLTTEHLLGVLTQYTEHYEEGDEDFVPIRLRLEDCSDALVAFEGSVDDDGYMVLAEAPMVVRLADGQLQTLVIDLVVSDASGALWAVDHKATTGYLGGRLTNKFIISHQPATYTLAVQALLGECEGAIINGIFMGASANNPRSEALRFDRYIYDYTPQQLEDTLAWLRVSQQVAQREEEEACDDEALWPQNPDAYCAGCDYLPLCEVSSTMRPSRIASYYTQEGDASCG